ncbi:MAG: subtilosin A family bacteriocin [Bacillales bacterium]|nr:subtilosin A family bacteriocin [Bacillales bacterium]
MCYEKGSNCREQGCSACSIGALCLADGPVPDFEVAAISGTFGLVG